jgi:hypothetical protein
MNKIEGELREKPKNLSKNEMRKGDQNRTNETMEQKNTPILEIVELSRSSLH